MAKLKAPTNLTINFKPSPKQMVVWKALMPECPVCGGKVEQTEYAKDKNGNPLFKPKCTCCGNNNIPQTILCGGAAGGGKALNINDLVLTPRGFVKMKDIKIGQEICTQDGKIAHVIAIHPQGKKHLWRIRTDDDISVRCCEDHIWKIYVHSKSAPQEMIVDMKTLLDMYSKGMKISIPLCKAQEQSGEWLSFIHPYIIGVLLGDGGLTGNMTITNNDEFVIEKVKSLLPSGCNIYRIPNTQCSYMINNKMYIPGQASPVSPFKNEIRRLHLDCKSTEKRIPKEIMVASKEVRLECVRGLMDTDGYVDSRGHCSLTVCNMKLAEDFEYLVRSLGMKANITRQVKSCIYKGERKYANAYNVRFNGPNKEELITLPRRKDLIKPNGKWMPRMITSIEDYGYGEAQCITIDDPSGMFITNDFLPTHNSYLAACWLNMMCIKYDGVRMFVARTTLKSIRESIWKTIADVLKSWGLIRDVHWKENNIFGYIEFYNGSTIQMVELAPSNLDPEYQRLGSSEYSGGYIEEAGEVDEKGAQVLMSRIRYKVQETTVTPKCLLGSNPSLNWIKSRFVYDEEGNEVQCAEGDLFVPFQVFDNPDENFRRSYVQSLMRIKDVALRERLLNGNWLWVDGNEAAAYWSFDGSKHLVYKLKENCYNSILPIVLAIDFNVMPYMSCLALQFDYNEKKVYAIEEILGKHEEKTNNTPALARKIAQKYLSEGHMGGLIITGDPAGLARSTQTEDGVNNFTILMNELSAPQLHACKKLLTTQPPLVQRLEFVNSVLDGFDGWEVLIDMQCNKFKEDLIYQRKNQDGTKEKKKVTDAKLKVKYEKYGHLSDCFDYALCYFLSDAYIKFKRQNTSQVITTADSSAYGTMEW